MIYTATAPGKLVLLGEYGVLEGGEALVMAVNRRVRVSLEYCGDPGLTVTSKPLLDQPVNITLGDIEQASPSGALALVTHILRQLSEQGLLPLESLAGWCLNLDSQALFQDGKKMGLGSSAAVTVALTGLLCDFAEKRQFCDLALVSALHHSFQGSGSGLDVATSLRGGLIAYCRHKNFPTVEQLSWPNNLHATAVWSGQSAGTAGFIQRLREFESDQPLVYAQLMKDLVREANTGLEALQRARAEDFLSCASAFYQTLGRLDEASGLGIVTETHQALAQLLKGDSSLYKTCGAGGGDLGVFLTTTSEGTQVARAKLQQAGYFYLPLVPDDSGLTISRE